MTTYYLEKYNAYNEEISKKPTVFYGKQAIAIKKDGEGILPFHLFDERNWELLDHAKDIEVPEEFQIK